jgi:hypothetical protein
MLLLAAVFFLFAAIGVAVDVLRLGQTRLSTLVLVAVYAGVMAAAFVVAFFRRLAWLPLLIAVQIAVSYALDFLPPGPTLVPPGPVADTLQARLTANVVGLVVCVSVSYALFAVFATRSGRRFMQLETELGLAREIHHDLVPRIEGERDGFDVLAQASPSGDVGGDLADVVQGAGGQAWTAYLADVSGHGVGSGVLMAMVKSAVRMALTRDEPLGAMLRPLNDVLVAASQPQMFVTFAAVRPVAGGRMAFAVAGHLPILCWRQATAEVEELTIPQVALGILPGQAFEAGETRYEPDDVFLLVTDGLTEVFDAADVELGLEAVKQVLAAHARLPLPAIEKALVDAARAHGPQLDDQSLILVRARSAQTGTLRATGHAAGRD